jgi:hypothetical protein
MPLNKVFTKDSRLTQGIGRIDRDAEILVRSEYRSELDLELNEVYYTTSMTIRLRAGLSSKRDIVEM